MKKIISVFISMIIVITMAFSTIPVNAITDSEFISVDAVHTVSITNEGEVAYFYFAPTEDAVYSFYSIGDKDTLAAIYDADGNEIAYNDDDYDSGNFDVLASMKSGNIYFLCCCFYDESTLGNFKIKITKTDIKSVKFNDIKLYEYFDSSTQYDYNVQTQEYDIEWQYYDYYPTYTVTFNDGTVVESDEYGNLERNGKVYSINYYYDEQEEAHWQVGKNTAFVEGLGSSANINVEVLANPVSSVNVDDITLYEDWDCVVIDEEWSDILGEEITEPIKVYYYMPVYTVTFNDGTVVKSDELGYIEFNGEMYKSLEYYDDQDIDSQWGVGEHTATATIFGITSTFNVTVLPNPAQKIEFKDITIVKDWDYFTDYDEYDRAWKHYEYIPLYEVTLNDGTILCSDEDGYIKYNGKTYGTISFDDGQSYKTPWTDGTYTVKTELFGGEYTFNVTFVEMVSKLGDVNRDEEIDNNDLALLMQYINGWDVKIDEGACKVCGSDEITNNEYALLMQVVNGWDIKLG